MAWEGLGSGRGSDELEGSRPFHAVEGGPIGGSDGLHVASRRSRRGAHRKTAVNAAKRSAFLERAPRQ